jgi:hypothetical protein
MAVVLPGCWASDAEVTSSGRGLPGAIVEFPEEARARSVQTAAFRISNPGPGAISSLAVAFARVGNDRPIVDSGARGRNEAVVEVDPEPLTVDQAGVVYRFEGLDEGDSLEISFRLRIPDVRGPAANSVTVYAAEDLERVRGLRLETVVK